MNKIWPTFFIIGAAKSGTTSLYNYLRQHPEIYMPAIKEPHYFSNVSPTQEQARFVKVISDQEQYLDLFRDAFGYRAIGEASPSYMLGPDVHKRICELVPNARFIAILRDPIERAYSHYLMDVRRGRQELPFFEAILEDYNSKEKGWGVSHLYVELGYYFRQLKPFIETSGQERVLVLLFDDLTNNPKKLLAQVADFLGVSQSPINDIMADKIHNSFMSPRNEFVASLLEISDLRNVIRKLAPNFLKSFLMRQVLLKSNKKPELEIEARNFLAEKYFPEIQMLENLIDRDLGCLMRL